MRRATIAPEIARDAFDLAASRGAPWKSLAARSGIDPNRLQDADRRVPFEHFDALLRAARDLCDDPAFGLRLGEACNEADLSVTGAIARCSDTLGDALDQVLRYDRMVGDAHRCTAAMRWTFGQRCGDTWLLDPRERAGTPPMFTEACFARLLSATRRLFGERRIFSAMHVAYAAPTHRDDYERMLGIPVRFHSDCTGLRLADRSWMALATPTVSRFFGGILGERTQALMESLQRADTLAGRMESLLIPVLHLGEVNAECIAARLGMSRFALLRGLKKEGTSADRVYDDLRRRLALGYLDELRISVPQVAFLVGYSDTRVFERAFERWTGTTPGRHRMALREQRSARGSIGRGARTKAARQA